MPEHIKRPGRPAGKPAGMDTYERFLTLVDSAGGVDACHQWLATTGKGYGRFTVGGKKVTAVRWLLGHLRGVPLEPHEFALHRCDNPPCCNPRHLYVGDAAQNVRDMNERNRNPLFIARRTATHCKHGHEFTPENTYNYDGSRHCKACRCSRSAEARQRRMAEGAKR